MINAGILRTTENASSAQNNIKSEQKHPRLRAKALGDVQNTLHSRPTNFANINTNSAVKAPNKSSIHVSSASRENNLPNKTPSGKKINVTPTKSTVKSLLATPSFDEVYETHQHNLCEEDQQSFLNDIFSEYKFSEEEIKSLVRSVKIPGRPFKVTFYEPCEDIEIPRVKIYEENAFSICDILGDMIIPEVPPLQ